MGDEFPANYPFKEQEESIRKLEEKNKKHESSARQLKKNVVNHQMNEKSFKEKCEALESENTQHKETISSLNSHVSNLKATLDQAARGTARKKEILKDKIQISNYGGGAMTVENITALLGLNDNPEIKEHCSLTVKDTVCEAVIPSTITEEVVELDELDIDGRKLSIEVLERGKSIKICHYYQKGGIRER